MSLRGSRPRPRVALLGEFDPVTEDALRAMFPTLWAGSTIGDLKSKISAAEVDLVIAESVVDVLDEGWTDPHLICFSQIIARLPGPLAGTLIYQQGQTETEEFILKPLPLPLHKVRAKDLQAVSNTRDWIKIGLIVQHSGSILRAAAEDALASGTILLTTEGPAPLGAFYLRREKNRGLAWLPNRAFDRVNWITALTNLWAEIDPQSFPTIGNWARSKTWMLGTELALLNRISGLEQEKEEAVRSFDLLIEQATHDLDALSLKIDNSRRRLISEQGDALVDEVASVLEEIGFKVEMMDEALTSGTPKREDLRLRVPTADSEWEAIVEVRGYSRSGGTTADLQRLERFAALYRLQRKREPDKKIYIVNPQTELPPGQRDLFSRSASEDISVFAEGEGLVISTLDLFRALKSTLPENLAEIRRSIIESRGTWAYSASISSSGVQEPTQEEILQKEDVPAAD